jgi:hypothetical protein
MLKNTVEKRYALPEESLRLSLEDKAMLREHVIGALERVID